MQVFRLTRALVVDVPLARDFCSVTSLKEPMLNPRRVVHVHEVLGISWHLAASARLMGPRSSRLS